MVMDVGLPFSSSLTLREVMELLFAVGARRWRLAKSFVASYQVLMNGGIRQVGDVTSGGGAVAALLREVLRYAPCVGGLLGRASQSTHPLTPSRRKGGLSELWAITPKGRLGL